ncbi:hypothetical protein [Botrimarina mediterranea]|uniref:Uncharacterized protein n=1 Tax=Botrimarina mediterranea TaxID=2528022 RepID=A0A518K4A2_9BACT|nr:hypothetical protein [Botrimarina mediterranea]QDV72595.1 hypothetical protein Spa11_07740 [Botrimarina mediterranea]
MNRRQLIAAAAAVLLIVANGAVWYARRQPERTPPNTRQVLRKQIVDSWEDLSAVPLADAPDALRQTISTEGRLEQGRNAAGFGRSVAHRPLTSHEQVDLIDAITGAVTAIGAADPDTLVAYMRDRGLKSASDSSKAISDIEPHCAGVVAGATQVYLWKPRSLREVSMVQMGRNESWVWGNERIYLPSFTGNPIFEQVSRTNPALLADVRVLIEHDDGLGRIRSPYFFRFWYAEDSKQWRPLALKIVWTGNQEPPSVMY